MREAIEEGASLPAVADEDRFSLDPEGGAPPPASNPEEAPPGYPPLYITITKGDPEGSGDASDPLKGVPASQERIDELRKTMEEQQYDGSIIRRELDRYKELPPEQREDVDKLVGHGLHLEGAIEVARAAMADPCRPSLSALTPSTSGGGAVGKVTETARESGPAAREPMPSCGPSRADVALADRALRAARHGHCPDGERGYFEDD